jgi:uncharacterized protein (DUF983 family)
MTERIRTETGKERRMNDGSTNSGATGSISFCGLLTILFIGLKLTGYIAWSWWWILSPLWIPVAVIIVISAIAARGKIKK